MEMGSTCLEFTITTQIHDHTTISPNFPGYHFTKLNLDLLPFYTHADLPVQLQASSRMDRASLMQPELIFTSSKGVAIDLVLEV